MPGFDLPWRLLPETKQAISRGLDYFEETGKATWTKLQRGLVEAGTAAMNAVAMSGATSQGFSPAAAMYTPLVGEDVGTELGAGEAFSPEALEREESLDPVTGFATDLVAGIPTMMMGGAGEVADIAIAQAEAERSGMGPLGQAATTLLAGAPLIGARTAGKIVREIGGGTAKQAQDEFAAVLREAGTVPPKGKPMRPAGRVEGPAERDITPTKFYPDQNRAVQEYGDAMHPYRDAQRDEAERMMSLADEGERGPVTVPPTAARQLSEAAARAVRGRGLTPDKLSAVRGRWLSKVGDLPPDAGFRYYRVHAPDERIGSVLRRKRPDGWVADAESLDTQPIGVSSADSLDKLDTYRHSYGMRVDDDALILEMRGAPGGDDVDQFAVRVVPDAVRVIGTGKEFKQFAKNVETGDADWSGFFRDNPEAP